ncbi:MAG: hypothetical protein ACM3SO_03825 [Betaproteobacteria bacterium]
MAAQGEYGGKHRLSFEAYHTIPEAWEAPALLEAHRALGGTADLRSTPRPSEGRAGTTDFRAVWYNLADGARAGDAACIELAVRFIEAQLVVSYAGFARSRLARALRHAKLSPEQAQRLSSHFLRLLEADERCEEFSEYLKLWPAVVTPADRARAAELATHARDPEAPFWRRLRMRVADVR